MDSTKPDLTQTVTELAVPLAASLGLAIWGVEIVPAGRCIIRVFAESLDAFAEGRSIMTDSDTQEAGALLTSGPLADPELPESSEFASEPYGKAKGEGSDDAVSQGGITIDQCAELSRLLGLTLEVEDCIEAAYVLEVSSPGLNRLFFQPEQLARAIGAKVEATLVKPLPDFPGRKKYIGTVARVEGDVCTLSVAEPEDVTVDIPWVNIKKVKQIYVMPEKKLPGKSLKNTRQKKSAAKKKK